MVGASHNLVLVYSLAMSRVSFSGLNPEGPPPRSIARSAAVDRGGLHDAAASGARVHDAPLDPGGPRRRRTGGGGHEHGGAPSTQDSEPGPGGGAHVSLKSVVKSDIVRDQSD